MIPNLYFQALNLRFENSACHLLLDTFVGKIYTKYMIRTKSLKQTWGRLQSSPTVFFIPPIKKKKCWFSNCSILREYYCCFWKLFTWEIWYIWISENVFVLMEDIKCKTKYTHNKLSDATIAGDGKTSFYLIKLADWIESWSTIAIRFLFFKVNR